MKMPIIPPAMLPSNDQKEIASAPSSVVRYPPAIDPTIIPKDIRVFRDIVVVVYVPALIKFF
jgi:hypothetical protein